MATYFRAVPVRPRTVCRRGRSTGGLLDVEVAAPEFRLQRPEHRCARPRIVLRVEDDPVDVVFDRVVGERVGVLVRAEQVAVGTDDGQFHLDGRLVAGEVLVGPHPRRGRGVRGPRPGPPGQSGRRRGRSRRRRSGSSPALRRTRRPPRRRRRRPCFATSRSRPLARADDGPLWMSQSLESRCSAVWRAIQLSSVIHPSTRITIS